MQTVVVFIVLVVIKAAFNTFHPDIPLVRWVFRTVGGQRYVLAEFDRPAHVHNNELKGAPGRWSHVEVEPNIVAVSVGIIRDQKIVAASFFTFEYAVQIPSLEFRRKLYLANLFDA